VSESIDWKDPDTHDIVYIPRKVFNAFLKVTGSRDSIEVRDNIIKLIESRTTQLKNIKKTMKNHKENGTGNYGRKQKEISLTEIRNLKKEGLTQKEIGKKFGVSGTTISRRLNQN